MRRLASVAVAALTGTGLLAACGTEPECVTIPSRAFEALKSGHQIPEGDFGNYGGVETTIAGRNAYVVAVDLNGLAPGVWRVGNSGGTPGPILAANDIAAIVAEWPRDRDEDELLVSPAESCI
ncbi:hypothetical protein G6027_10295 [Dietzia sp. SLG310A2-38A2]|uniref:hypothetical protein n=1 Tax=Dietzia sp. SLG310A2-38A2 TaxID=1630643 RepID=UPI0015FA8ABD|nr:hypothetical protein [Dietzia sp. SLG310A2-38A2]MBB1031270.1 hypothetical protein [Dietzia sp. SLG310A2-38A2]